MASLNGRIKRLEQRLQPEAEPPQLISEDTGRALDAIAAAKRDGIISHGEPLDVDGLTNYLIRCGVPPEAAPGYVADFARIWPGGTDLRR
jgi:hypothetical protein